MEVFARHQLAAAEFARRAALGDPQRESQPALLLEGSWPHASGRRQLVSLDETIDSRFAWIDEEASRLAEQIDDRTLLSPCWHKISDGDREDRFAQRRPAADGAAQQPAPAVPSVAHLHALALRYFLVKLLRLIAFVQEVVPLPPRSTCQLFATRGLDEDYAELLAELGRAGGFDVAVHWFPLANTNRANPSSARFQRAKFWLRFRLGQLNHWLDQRIPKRHTAERRVVLCGNPRVLEPVCEELLLRRVGTWWLYDRLAFGCWRRWRHRGVRQLNCHAKRGDGDDYLAPARELPRIGELCVRGIRIDGIIERWIADQMARSDGEDARFFHRTVEHLRCVKPQAIVLDEDATPKARSAIAAARHLAIPAWVVQHGVPAVRFGFAPLVADRFCAADEPSRRRLLDWGAPDQRVLVSGCPALDALQQRFSRRGMNRRSSLRSVGAVPTFLLLATTPPRDDRPDAVEFHLTTNSYAELLEATVAAVAAIAGAKLWVKPHPRDPHPLALVRLLHDKSRRRVCQAPRGTVEQLLPEVDVVLSLGSTGGIEAAALGWPVIQLLPHGSGELIPAAAWNLVGTARNAAELTALLPIALERGRRQQPRSTGNRPAINPAAARVVDFVLQGCAAGRGHEVDRDLSGQKVPQMAG